MEVDDIIQAFGTVSQTLRRESLRPANVTREAGRAIGNSRTTTWWRRKSGEHTRLGCWFRRHRRSELNLFHRKPLMMHRWRFYDRCSKTCPRISRRDWAARRFGQSTRTEQIARATNGRHPRDETRHDQSGQIVAAARSQITQALLIRFWIHLS